MAKWPSIGTRYIQQTFSPGGGLDEFRNPLQLAPEMASNMHGGSLRQHPALRTRDGRKQMYAPVIAQSIRHIHITPDGVTHIIVGNYALGEGNSWYYWNETTSEWTLINTGTDINQYWSYYLADWYDYTTSSWFVFCTRYDGATGVDVSYWNPVAKTFTQIAHATYPVVFGPMCSHMNRMFVTPESATGNLGYSKVADPLTWTSPDGGIIPVGNNAQITSLLSMTDRLFIGTTKGVYVLLGDSGSNFTVQTVTTEFGIPTGDHAVLANGIVYCSDGMDVYEYYPGEIRKISREAEGNGVRGGFPPCAAPESGLGIFDTSYQSSSYTSLTRAIVSMGANTDKVICNTTETDTGALTGKSIWYVFDIKHRRWTKEIGYYKEASTVNTCFGTTEWGRIVASSYRYYSSMQYIFPRLYQLDCGTAYDNHIEYNLVNDGAMTDASKFIAMGGTDAITGGIYTVTGNGSSNAPGFSVATTLPVNTNRSCYVRIEALVTDAVCQQISLSVQGSTGGTVVIASQNAPTANVWYTLADIKAEAGLTGYLSPTGVAVYADAATANGKVVKFRNIICDDISFTFGYGGEPTKAQYEAEFPSGNPFVKINPTSTLRDNTQMVYYSPKFLVRPSAKKTLANIWLTVDTTNAYSPGSFLTYTSSDGTNWTQCSNEASPFSTSQLNRKYKIPIKGSSFATGKQEYVQVKVVVDGDACITGLTLDWRIVERTK